MLEIRTIKICLAYAIQINHIISLPNFIARFFFALASAPRKRQICKLNMMITVAKPPRQFGHANDC